MPPLSLFCLQLSVPASFNNYQLTLSLCSWKAHTDSSVTVADYPDGWDFVHPRFFGAVGIMAFAFVCHAQAFLVRNTMAQPTAARWAKATHVRCV